MVTDFEAKLKQFFPEIYQLQLLSKSRQEGGAGEINIFLVIDSLVDMANKQATGRLMINYSKGHIDKISVTQDKIAVRRLRPENDP